MHYLFFSLVIIIIDATHFNGGTIRWVPVDDSTNASIITISIIQSYWWTYPYITCAANVPISTSGRSSHNANLTCVTDCSTDGGYSIKPVNILTDCISVSTALRLMASQRSVNINLTAGAHFYLAYVGSAWSALNYPLQYNLDWSIVSYIDLRKRIDGFINTPPVATISSPQYVIVNKTTIINIIVSDANPGDDVRCRWSTYTSGFRRRKRSDEEKLTQKKYAVQLYKTMEHEENNVTRIRRQTCVGCGSTCPLGCTCNCGMCDLSICTGISCVTVGGCGIATTTSTTITIDTPGTLKLTSSYPNRQSIDECGGICYPTSVPIGTTLSNCALNFTGSKAGVWYAVAIQVKINVNCIEQSHHPQKCRNRMLNRSSFIIVQYKNAYSLLTSILSLSLRIFLSCNDQIFNIFE